MAAFVFTGDPRAPGKDPQTCLSYGLTFTLNGKPVEAPNDEIAEKLRRHTHFTEVGKAASAKADDPDLDDMKVDELRTLADERGLDHEGMSKAELREALR